MLTSPRVKEVAGGLLYDSPDRLLVSSSERQLPILNDFNQVHLPRAKYHTAIATRLGGALFSVQKLSGRFDLFRMQTPSGLKGPPMELRQGGKLRVRTGCGTCR